MRKGGLLSLLAVLAWSVSFCVPARAQFGHIRGVVVGEDGQPAVGAEIVTERTDRKGNYKTKTDKNGRYYQGNLSVIGTYNLTLLIDGQKKRYTNGVTIRGGTRVIDFNLKKGRERALARRAGLQVGEGGSSPRNSADKSSSNWTWGRSTGTRWRNSISSLPMGWER